jgi:hypothetical protein
MDRSSGESGPCSSFDAEANRSLQAIWLSLAYQLEFRGKQVFLVLWAGSLLVLGANSYVLVQIVKNYSLLS